MRPGQLFGSIPIPDDAIETLFLADQQTVLAGSNWSTLHITRQPLSVKALSLEGRDSDAFFRRVLQTIMAIYGLAESMVFGVCQALIEVKLSMLPKANPLIIVFQNCYQPKMPFGLVLGKAYIALLKKIQRYLLGK